MNNTMKLVERLRSGNWKYLCDVRGLIDDPIATEAADTIESLEARVKCLEEALDRCQGRFEATGDAYGANLARANQGGEE